MAKAEKGGGRLGRSETVTIRLDPKMNYLADLAARSQRRTKSSLIEAALADALNVIKVDVRPHCQNSTTLAQIGDEIWHVDEPERLRRLAQLAPHLMTYEEQKIWAVLEKNGTFWFGEWRPLNETKEYYSYDAEPRKMYMRAVEDHWDQVKKIAAGEADASTIPERTVRFKGGSLTLAGALSAPIE